jgi:hypothetical protein
VEFGIQAALDSSGLAKAVLLAGKQQITNWFAFATLRPGPPLDSVARWRPRLPERR